MDAAVDVVERVARQRCEGLAAISATNAYDLGETTVETHHVFADGELVPGASR